MKQFFEDVWEALPAALEAPHFEARRRFLLSEVQRGERLLDLGCGDGRFTALAAAAGVDVLGVDVAEAALRRARAAHPELAFALAPVEGPLPLDDGAFDVVWASEVIEHVADTARWLSEVRRVLTPGGRLLVTTPAHGRLAMLVRGVERHSPPLGDHLHLYTKSSLGELLREFGFGEIVLRSTGGAPLIRELLLARAVR